MDLPHSIHRPLPLEMNCEMYKFLIEPIQRKFIWVMGRGIYAMFRQKLLRKTKQLRNSEGNKWHRFSKPIKLSPDGFNVKNNTMEWAYVFALEEFAISAEHSRLDNFPGTILYYFEVKRIGNNVRLGLSDGVIFDRNSPSSFYLHPSPLLIANSNNECFYFYDLYIAGKVHQLSPGGAKKYDPRNVYGCGLVIDIEDKLSIFFTSNGMLIDRKIPISPTVDRLFPTVRLDEYAAIEANFGNDKDKPFEYDIKNCPGMGLDGI